MELFHEIYGRYYHVVGRILQEAHATGLSRGEIDEIIAREGFAESGLHLLPRLLSGEWDLLREEDGLYYSKLKHPEIGLPLTLLEKSWIKTLFHDRRIRLFLSQEQQSALEEKLQEVDPLFLAGDFHCFDAAADADPYEDEAYIQWFRLVLWAIKEKKPLLTEYEGGKGGRLQFVFQPERLLYSAKDDKFRLLGRRCSARNQPVTLNLARLKSLQKAQVPATENSTPLEQVEKRSVRLAIYQERNALERCMLQFASYDKQTVFDDDRDCYLCEIFYDTMEETELLIRILSFGPVVEVLGPKHMLSQVQQRIRQQFKRLEGYTF